MPEENKVLYEILKELLATNKEIKEQLNKSTEKQIRTFDEVINQNHEQGIVLQQMAEYLKNPQIIADYVVKDYTKHNERMIRELAMQFKKACHLFNPEIIGMNRPNYTIISSQSNPVHVSQNTSTANPVYTLNKTNLIQYAENAFLQVYNTAYYRVGYYPNLGNSFSAINDGVSTPFPDVLGATQTLSVKSSSASDRVGGTGVQMVLAGGLDSSGNRYSEVLSLNGTTAVTTSGTFSQLDSLFSIATGSNNGAVGTITLSGGSDSIAYAAIQTGNNAWRSGRFFADTKAVGYIDAWSFGSFTDATRGQLRTSAEAGDYDTFTTRAAVIVQNNTVQLLFPVPIRILKSTAAMIRGISKAPSGTEVTTNFELHFVTE